MHTDSGLDTEDICPASPTNSRLSITESPGGGGTGKQHKHTHGVGGVSDANTSSGGGGGGSSFAEEENLRLVLVRDIGIQCCTDSPATVRRRNTTTMQQQTPPLGSVLPPTDTPILVVSNENNKGVTLDKSLAGTNSAPSIQQNNTNNLARGHSNELLF